MDAGETDIVRFGHHSHDECRPRNGQRKVDGGAHDVGPHVSQVLAEQNLGTAPRQAALAERPSGARV